MTKSDQKQPIYPAEKVRSGQIILDTPLKRAIFIGGLIGLVVLAILFAIYVRPH